MLSFVTPMCFLRVRKELAMNTPPPPPPAALPRINKKRSAEPETVARNLRRQLEVNYWIECRRNTRAGERRYDIHIPADLGEALLRDPDSAKDETADLLGVHLVGRRFHTGKYPIVRNSTGQFRVLLNQGTHWLVTARNDDEEYTQTVDLIDGNSAQDRDRIAGEMGLDFLRDTGMHALAVTFTNTAGDEHVVYMDMGFERPLASADAAQYIFSLFAGEDDDATVDEQLEDM